MIKHSNNVHISLDTIYSELIQLATSVAECKTSIKHVEGMINSSYIDTSERLKLMSQKINLIEAKEDSIQHKVNYVHELFKWSLINFFKWGSFLIMSGIIIGSGSKIDISSIVSSYLGFIFK